MFARHTTKGRTLKAIAYSLLLASFASSAVAVICPISATAQGNSGASGTPAIPAPPGIPGQPISTPGLIPGQTTGGNIMPQTLGTPLGPGGVPFPYSQPGVITNTNNPIQPIPEPPGAGPTPAPEKPFDTIAPLPPPSGNAGNGPGTGDYNFVNQDRTEVLVYVNNAMALVIRPDQLSATQVSQIDGILGINMLSGQQQIKVSADTAKIQQIQAVLNPPPNFSLESLTRPFIQKDPTTGISSLIYQSKQFQTLPFMSGQAQQNQATKIPNIYNFQGPLPVIRPFARWLVLVGLVACTIWVASAAGSIVWGHPFAAQRVGQALFGMASLLCAYTVYKIVILDMMHANTDQITTALHRPNTALVQDQYMQSSSAPFAVPLAIPTRPQRQGLPVAPLAAPTNP